MFRSLRADPRVCFRRPRGRRLPYKERDVQRVEWEPPEGRVEVGAFPSPIYR